jgi:Beta-propeller repeat
MVLARPGRTAGALTLLSSVIILSACGEVASTPRLAERAQQTASARQASDSARAFRCLKRPCIYVANRNGGLSHNGTVTIYAVGANGNVAPIHTIGGANTGLVGPVRVALDASHNVYVTNNPTDSGPGWVTVYAAGAHGNASPIRKISGSNTGLSSPYGIALDSSGNIYVTNADANSVTVYAAGADGNVAPIRTISGSNTGMSAPTGIAVSATGKIAVASFDGGVAEYAANANGNAKPIKDIIGESTGLVYALGVALGVSGKIYVVNRGGGPSSIGSLTVFAAKANGNVPPLQTIGGSITGLDEPWGIAETAKAIYAANASTPSITVYASDANGNVAPTRTISGPRTALIAPTGVTVR